MTYRDLPLSTLVAFAKDLARVYGNAPGLFEELLIRKQSARESALMDVNEFLFSERSPLSPADRYAIAMLALDIAAAAKAEANDAKKPTFRIVSKD